MTDRRQIMHRIKKIIHKLGFHFFEDVTWWSRDWAFNETHEWRGFKCSVCQRIKKQSFIRAIRLDHD